MRNQILLICVMLSISLSAQKETTIPSIAKKTACLKELLELLPRDGPVLKTLPRQSGSLDTVAERVQGSVLIVVSQ